MDLNEFLTPLKYGATVSGDLTFSNAGGTITLAQGLPFFATASCGTATGSVGCTILADSVVTQNRSVFLQGFIVRSGVGIWITSSGSTLNLQDSAGTVFASFGSISTTLLDASTNYHPFSGGSVTLYDPFRLAGGGSPAKGIILKNTPATGTTSSGSNVQVTIWGIIK